MINEVMAFAFDVNNFEADFAQTYQQIIMKIKQKKYDLIVIDIDLNGFDLIERVKKSDINSETDIFFLSENTDTELRKKAKELGVSGWIIKPFIPENLVKNLRIYLASK